MDREDGCEHVPRRAGAHQRTDEMEGVSSPVMPAPEVSDSVVTKVQSRRRAKPDTSFRSGSLGQDRAQLDALAGDHPVRGLSARVTNLPLTKDRIAGFPQKHRPGRTCVSSAPVHRRPERCKATDRPVISEINDARAMRQSIRWVAAGRAPDEAGDDPRVSAG
jgi:hypothetical protein